MMSGRVRLGGGYAPGAAELHCRTHRPWSGSISPEHGHWMFSGNTSAAPEPNDKSFPNSNEYDR
jgi:hypothetical protein